MNLKKLLGLIVCWAVTASSGSEASGTVAAKTLIGNPEVDINFEIENGSVWIKTLRRRLGFPKLASILSYQLKPFTKTRLPVEGRVRAIFFLRSKLWLITDKLELEELEMRMVTHYGPGVPMILASSALTVPSGIFLQQSLAGGHALLGSVVLVASFLPVAAFSVAHTRRLLSAEVESKIKTTPYKVGEVVRSRDGEIQDVQLIEPSGVRRYLSALDFNQEECESELSQ